MNHGNISLRTRLYGEGLFETILWRGITNKLKSHYNRLNKSSSFFNIPCPDFAEFVRHIVSITGNEQDIYVKYCLYSEGEPLFYKTPSKSRHEVIKAPLPQIPEEVSITYSPFRYHSSNPLIYHKTMNYLFNIIVKREAIKRGFYDAIVLNEFGNICECSSSNIIIYDGRQLITPSRKSGLLYGTTLSTLSEKIQINERPINYQDIQLAKSVFILNSIIEILPVKAIDGIYFEIDKAILNDCKAIIQRENSKS